MRVCVVTPSKPGLTETFILAHIERLPHDILHLYGHSLDYHWKEGTLREWHKRNYGAGDNRWLNIFPRYLEFRVRRRFFSVASNIQITSEFLQAQEIDVVLAEYGTIAAAITPACISAGVPLVAHFHGFDASRYRIRAEFSSDYKEMFSLASSVISVSAVMSQALLEMGCPEEKICYNPYGPHPDFSDIEPDYTSNTLIAVGRHTSKKAPYLTLDAFRIALKSCPNLKLRFVGDGELFEVSERLVNAWNLKLQVDLVGQAEPKNIREMMGSAFAFIQHSVQASDGDSEGMPVAILEAGAAGLPVISTCHAGIPEAVIEGQTGFVIQPGNSQDMAQRIVELANNRELAKNMGAAARIHISEHFSLKRHIAVLDRALGKAKSERLRQR